MSETKYFIKNQDEKYLADDTKTRWTWNKAQARSFGNYDAAYAIAKTLGAHVSMSTQ